VYGRRASPMRLHKLSLENFRGFEKLELDFAPAARRPVVLVGVNGAGKSTILDAISLMLSLFVSGVRLGRPAATIPSENDIRLGAGSCVISLTAEFLTDDPVTWQVASTRSGFPVQRATDDRALFGAIGAVQQAIANGSPRLPLAVYYPTNRSALDIPDRIRTPYEYDVLSPYVGALDGQSIDFRGFFAWFREEEDIYNEQLARSKTNEEVATTRPALEQVRRAIEEFFPGASELRIERRPQRMTLKYKELRLDVSQLSDGEKCVLAMIGDLARRMVLAAPALSNPLEQEAVVLIDEIELHLHPALQRTVLPRLQQVFPNTQFIVSTHSPQVLSSVLSASVRLLDQFECRSLDRGTWRRDTIRILEAAFGDAGRPSEVAAKLQALKAAVDEDQIETARRLIRELNDSIEGQDPEVFFYEQLLPPEQP
jgi:predicted ATP-binding protein involved in virulence